MLRTVGEPRRIDRAVRRLQAALRGIPARGVRLTWRGGELRTTIQRVRDDGFWFALEPRGEGPSARLALVLGHAPDPPGRRENITCEINLALGCADRKVAGLIAADEAGTLDVVLRACYEVLGYITVFTGDFRSSESRAWHLPKGWTAKQAAGRIHSDIEHGFVRAQVVRIEDLIELGSFHAAREKALLRTEGKEYVVQDGDVINFMHTG